MSHFRLQSCRHDRQSCRTPGRRYQVPLPKPFTSCSAFFFMNSTQVLNHMIKGLCGSAKAYACLIRDERSNTKCTAWAEHVIGALSTASEWAHRRQVLVSLADGTYMSMRTSVDVDTLLRQMVSDRDIVQVVVPASGPPHGYSYLPCASSARLNPRMLDGE